MIGNEWIGRTIDGRYVVDAVIGSGGMGFVLAARHQFTGARVAVKLLKPEVQVDPGLQTRFLAEARAPSAIGHPGIAQVLDAGRTQSGELYLVMELLSGRSLRDELTATQLPPAEVRRIVLALLDALAAAHAHGFIHRDLKPDNVFLSGPERAVKLLDFGIAKVMSPEFTHRPMTAAGAVMGTVAYMSPEQIADSSRIDARADLWAVAIMLYEMLCRALPYRGTTIQEVFVAVATGAPEPITRFLPAAPPPLEAFFARAFARDPQYRFQSAAELAQAIAALPLGGATEAYGGAGRSTPVPPPSFVGRPSPMPTYPGQLPPGVAMTAAPPARKSSRGLVIGALVAVAAIAGIIVAATRGGGKAADKVAATDPPKAGSEAPPPAPPPPPPTPAPPDAADLPMVFTLGPDTIAPAKEPKHAPAPAPHVQHTQRAPAPQPPPQPQPQPAAPAADDLCPVVCSNLGSCGLGGNSCMSDCQSHRSAMVCFKQAGHDCNQLMACGFAMACNGVMPRGTGTCQAAAACQAQCGNNTACICSCASQMAPSHATVLLQLDLCVAACGTNQQCLTSRCAGLFQTCAAQ